MPLFLHRLQLQEHGAELFADDEATAATLQRHLLRTTASDCMDALLRYLAADLPSKEESNESKGAGGATEGEAAAGPLPAAERAAIVKQLGPDVKGAASAALEKLGGASLEVRGCGGGRRPCSLQRLKGCSKWVLRALHWRRRAGRAWRCMGAEGIGPSC